MSKKALLLTETGLSAPPGEPITDPEELPDDLDDLLALANNLREIASVANTLRKEVEAKAATVLGPGKWYQYGDAAYTWNHSYRWKAHERAVENLIRNAAAQDPDLVTGLFNPNSIRKTAIGKVARALGMDPEVAVGSILYKEWSKEPGLRSKPIDL